MAVLFNGVLVSREAGSLMPSMNLDKVKITDTVMNAIKLDSGANKLTKDDTGEHSVPINSDKNNLPIIHNGAWSLETEFYANFNGDLEAGPLSFYGNEINGMAIRRSSNRDNFSNWEDIRVIDDITNVVNKDNEYSFKDRCIESGNGICTLYNQYLELKGVAYLNLLKEHLYLIVLTWLERVVNN